MSDKQANSTIVITLSSGVQVLHEDIPPAKAVGIVKALKKGMAEKSSAVEWELRGGVWPLERHCTDLTKVVDVALFEHEREKQS